MSHIPYYGQPENKGNISMSGNKNGYEIRAQVLEYAKQYVEEHKKLNIAYAEKMRALGRMQIDAYLEAIKPYSMQEILDKATEMYSFVSRK